MAAPYSMDLRQRVIEAVEGGLSCNQAAARFDVAISTAIGWVNRYRETGSVAAARMGGHRPKKLVGDYRYSHVGHDRRPAEDGHYGDLRCR